MGRVGLPAGVALKTCRDCAKPMGTTADVCPHCGEKTAAKKIADFMSATASLIFMLVIAYIIWGD